MNHVLKRLWYKDRSLNQGTLIYFGLNCLNWFGLQYRLPFLFIILTIVHLLHEVEFNMSFAMNGHCHDERFWLRKILSRNCNNSTI